MGEGKHRDVTTTVVGVERAPGGSVRFGSGWVGFSKRGTCLVNFGFGEREECTVIFCQRALFPRAPCFKNWFIVSNGKN